MTTQMLGAIRPAMISHAGPMIEVAGLTKTYPGRVRALDGIDFEIAAGEVFGLLGPNGAGKSTIVGILTTTSPRRPGPRDSPASMSPGNQSRRAASAASSFRRRSSIEA